MGEMSSIIKKEEREKKKRKINQVCFSIHANPASNYSVQGTE